MTFQKWTKKLKTSEEIISFIPFLQHSQGSLITLLAANLFYTPSLSALIPAHFTNTCWFSSDWDQALNMFESFLSEKKVSTAVNIYLN